jgi:hypothetical protein
MEEDYPIAEEGYLMDISSDDHWEYILQELSLVGDGKG